MKQLFMSLLVALSVTAAQAAVEAGLTYRIVSVKYPKKSLFVQNSAPAANTEVVLWTETDVPSQQWIVRATSTSAVALQSVYSGFYVTPRTQSRGGTLRLGRTFSSARVQLAPVDEAQNIYHITTNAGTFNLAVDADTDGTSPAWADKTEGDEQLWQLVEVEPKTDFTATMRDEMMDTYVRRFATSRGTSLRSFGNGGWGEAEQLEVALDAYESTGKETYLTLATQVYNYFYKYVGEDWCRLVYQDEYKWYGHDFNDDVMWQIIAVARLGWLTGESKYTTIAKKNWDKIYERSYIPFTGLMRWAQSSGNAYGTNSCIAGPAEVAACYLGMSGCGEDYFEKARDLYAAQRYSLANMSTGQVYDNVTWDPETQKVTGSNHWASTYNQGTMLGAACLLYDHYGTKQYLDDAKKIMEYTVKNLCNSDGIISVCQVNDGDLCGFKGILMRYVRRLVLDLNQPTYQAWLKKNALRAYCNRTEAGLTSSAWLTKSTAEVTTNGFSCSTAASAAVNAPLGDVVKDGFATIQAEAFDYHRSLQTIAAEGQGGDAVVYVKNGAWAQYDNVDFGESTARSVAIDVSSFVSSSATGSVEVYLDSLAGTPVGQLSFTQPETPWHQVLVDITPTTGMHHVILRFTYSTPSRSRAYRFDQFTFYTQTADEIRTGVETPATDLPTAPAEYFDLMGRRLSAAPAHGAFILRRGTESKVVRR